MAARTVRVRRISATGYDLLEAPLPVVIGGHPGAGRAALPVAQGDHGGAQQGDRDPVAGRPRPGCARRSVAPWRRPRSSTRGSRRPAPPPRSSAARPTRAPPASSTSSPSGGSSDGRAVGRRRARSRRRAGADQRRGRHARPRARPRRRAARSSGSSSRRTRRRRPRSWRPTCRVVLGDHRPGGGGPCLVGGRGRHVAALLGRAGPTRCRSSSAPAPTAATWPVPCRP